ncbi:MAG: tetratricopeptide repeat protein [Candidatus Thiodiazotropha sp. (ex Monitilora ramsayi)]|nr:tetratricopeptide repeat protein [Candidatus Thiodiazotropha sp. (ex Monitilora ramsayi)]
MDRNLDRLLEQAVTQVQHGHLDGAIDSLKQLLSLEPDCAEAHAYLSMCLLDKRRLHAATKEAEIAITLEPEIELSNYAVAHVMMAQRRFKEAATHLDRLLDIDPNDERYYRMYADLYHLTNEKDKILPALQKALELSPDNPDVLADLSDYYFSTDDLKLAEQFAEDALHREAEHKHGLVAMGNVLLRYGKVDEARQHAVWALRLDPDDRSALHLISSVKARSNLFLGLWWKYNSWISNKGTTRSILILLGAFIVYRIASMLSADLGHSDIARIINYIWLGIVIYTFVGPTIFTKSLKKEISEVQLNREF